MRGKTLAGLAASAVIAAIVVAPAPAQADQWGPVVAPGALYYTDDSELTYCYTQSMDSPSGARQVADYGQHNVVTLTTDLTSDLINPPTYCSSRNVNVWWWSVDITPAGVRGMTTCGRASTTDPTICESHNVYLDFAELDVGNLDWQNRRKTACHELGHVLGLQHNTTDAANSCMISGAVPNDSSTFRQYSAHHLNNHINVRY